MGIRGSSFRRRVNFERRDSSWKSLLGDSCRVRYCSVGNSGGLVMRNSGAGGMTYASLSSEEGSGREDIFLILIYFMVLCVSEDK